MTGIQPRPPQASRVVSAEALRRSKRRRGASEVRERWTQRRLAKQQGRSTGEAQGDKKRRRRRRKRKSAGPPTAGEASAPEGRAAADAAGEVGREGADAASVERLDRARRRAGKKPGPPGSGAGQRGRHVFGQDHRGHRGSHLVDIPGKAHAISTAARCSFGRRRAGIAPALVCRGAAVEAAPVALDAADVARGCALPPRGPRRHRRRTYASRRRDAETTRRSTLDARLSRCPRLKEPKVPASSSRSGRTHRVVHNDGARGGLVVLTQPEPGGEGEAWSRRVQREVTIEGLVTGVIKGGIEADVDGCGPSRRLHVDLRWRGLFSLSRAPAVSWSRNTPTGGATCPLAKDSREEPEARTELARPKSRGARGRSQRGALRVPSSTLVASRVYVPSKMSHNARRAERIRSAGGLERRVRSSCRSMRRT